MYISSLHIPLLQSKAASLRRQLSPLYCYDEWLLRERIASIFLGNGFIILVAISIFLAFDQDILSLVMLIFVLSVARGLYLDVVISRGEVKLLKLSVDSLRQMRHAYHRYNMVDCALEDTIEQAHPMLVPHLQRIATLLEDPDPDASMSAYEEAAPNRYYKIFAGLSRLVAEYGDSIGKDGSSYLKAMSMIIKEMQTELVMRAKLDYSLRGLKGIAVIPILFTDPLERWATTCFPTMELFYHSKLGCLLQLSVFLNALVCHHLLQQLQQRSSSHYLEMGKLKWSKQVLHFKGIRSMLERWVRSRHPAQIKKVRRLLNEANQSVTLEHFYGRRFSHVLCSMGIAILLLFLFYVMSLRWAWNQIELKSVDMGVRFVDVRRWVHNVPKHTGKYAIQLNLRTFILQEHPEWGERQTSELSKVLTPLAIHLHNIKVWWWEWLIPLLIGWIAYYFALFDLHIRIRAQHFDLRAEISQMKLLFMLLRAFHTMTVESVMEWMSHCSVIFRQPLNACLLNWESGSEQALQQLRVMAPYPDFVRIVDKLELAHNYIPLVESFDDAEQDWSYEQEMLRQHFEASIEVKAGWGRLLGFTPMYALIFLYLVFPLIWISMEQMRSSFEQIRQL